MHTAALYITEFTVNHNSECMRYCYNAEQRLRLLRQTVC